MAYGTCCAFKLSSAETTRVKQQRECVRLLLFFVLQAQMKKAAKEAAKKAAKGAAAAASGKMLFLEKGKDVLTEQM